MFTAEKFTNCSLVVYPERLKTNEGVLLGINLTEFVVVVLDVIEAFTHESTIEDVKRCIDFLPFKNLSNKLIKSEIKILGAVRHHDNPDNSAETVQRLSQFDIWLNLEYHADNAMLVFRDLILCGYKYNTRCNIVYYENEQNGLICSDKSFLELAFKDLLKPQPSIQTEHFDVNVYQVYKNLYQGKEDTLPAKQSKDLFDFICKVLNFRPLLLKMWRQVFNNKILLNSMPELDKNDSDFSFDVDNELDIVVDRELNKKRRLTSNDIINTGNMFKFDFDDTTIIQEKRVKKFSDELIDELEALQTPVIYKSNLGRKSSLKEEYELSMNFTKIPILEENHIADLNLLHSKKLGNAMVYKMLIYSMTVLVIVKTLTFMTINHLSGFIVGSTRVFSLTASQVRMKLKSGKLLSTRLAQLSVSQPGRVSQLIKEIAGILDILFLSGFDVILGVAFFVLWWTWGEQMERYIRDWEQLVHPDVFKRQLAMIGKNPAGIKLNLTYCGIISKLTQMIFIVQ